MHRKTNQSPQKSYISKRKLLLLVIVLTAITLSLTACASSSIPDFETTHSVRDLYPDLEVLITPASRYHVFFSGGVIQINVTVYNNGDQTIYYTASSEDQTPYRPLTYQIDGIQHSVRWDQLSDEPVNIEVIALPPGDQANLSIVTKAVEPNPNFDAYALKLFAEDEQYMGSKNAIYDIDWEELHEMFPDLVDAEPNAYRGALQFFYIMPEKSGTRNLADAPAGYFQEDFEFLVIER